MALRVHYYGEAAFRAEAEPVIDFNEELKVLLEAMLKALHEARGIGLAAQHLGLNKRICVIDFSDVEEDGLVRLDGESLVWAAIMPLFIINPEMELIGGLEELAEEGSISLPGIRGPIKRSKVVRLSYQDVRGVRHALEAEGLLSRCIQHEVDHLNGVLFIERMERGVLVRLETKLKQLRRQVKRGVVV